VVRPPHEVVGCLIVVYIVVGKTLVRVMVAEGAAENEKEDRERDDRKKRNTGEGGWFFVNFGLDFLHTHAMKSTSIYR